MDRMYVHVRRRKSLLWIILGHSICSIICSLFSFKKLVIDMGIENKAYAYFATGTTLAEDGLSKFLCMAASYILAAGLIFLFWKFCFCLLEKLKERRPVSFLFLVVLILGIVLVLCLYPDMFGVETTDDYMNYAYAKGFLPMYWHGFFTNVVYCACMIFVPHPIAIPLVQFLFGISVLFYLGSTFMAYLSGRKICQAALIICFIFMTFLLPETINILFYPTRNCMYAILTLGMMAILFADSLKKSELTKRKFVLLVCLFAISGSWRGEGILYLLAFPFLIWGTYLSGKSKPWSVFYDKPFRQVCFKATVFYMLVCVLFYLPDKYGASKYQNSDYMIANTTGPLSAVLHDEKAELSYLGAKEDLEKINKVIPLEFIYRYGCNGGFYYNAAEGRWVRQSGVSKAAGKNYVSSAYRVLFHNWPDYLKYQCNMFLDANCIKGFRFQVDFGKENMDNALELEPYVRAFLLYDAGKEDLQKYDFTIIHKSIECVGKRLFAAITINNSVAGIIKIFLMALTVFMVVMALIGRKFQYLFIAALNLALLAVIILLAPWSRPNYYYSVFFHMYWCLLYYLTVGFKRKCHE